VLVLRPEVRARSLLAALADAGATGQAIAVTAVRPPSDPASFDSAVLALAGGDYDWVGFTSVNAVELVAARARALRLDPAIPADTRVAAVGPATAAAAHALGIAVDLVPTGPGSAAALGAAWPAAAGGATALLPQSELAGDTLTDLLTAKGFRVVRVGAYRVEPVPLPATVAADLSGGSYDAVVLTAGSVVGALADTRPAAGTVVVALGEPTAEAARRTGLTPVVAERPTDDGLMAALVAALEHRRRR
jgi:uroporphyrinogen-III synthase